jgi:hypothetical protein
MVNSQMPNHAMMLALRKLPTLNVTLAPKNATHAKKVMKAATPPLSAPPLAVSHTPSATQPLESAQHVTQLPTRTAPKSSNLVTRNAKS